MKRGAQNCGWRAGLLPAILAIVLAACTANNGPASAYENQIVQARLAKDVSFFNPETTVLRPKELTKFTGLRYYPVDSTYRFVVPFRRLETPDTVLIAKQRSGPIPYRHIGFVGVSGPDTTIDLSVFWSEDMAPGTGWVPFTDPTNNVETYGGGRYLDIEIGDGDTATVDFNLAANPFCVYNAYDFNCAIPPASNRLTFPIRAGEKKALLLDD